MPACNRCGRVSASAEMRRSPKSGWLCKDKYACKRDRKARRFPVPPMDREPGLYSDEDERMFSS